MQRCELIPDVGDARDRHHIPPIDYPLLAHSPTRPVLLLFWLAVAVALFGQLRVLMSALAGRTPASGNGRAARVREVVWILLPALALALTLAATWRAARSSSARESAPGVARIALTMGPTQSNVSAPTPIPAIP